MAELNVACSTVCAEQQFRDDRHIYMTLSFRVLSIVSLRLIDISRGPIFARRYARLGNILNA